LKRLASSVADPYHFDSNPDPDPDPAFHFDADPDPAFQFDADLDPAPDPTTHFFLCLDPPKTFVLFFKSAHEKAKFSFILRVHAQINLRDFQ
jgi:hypothetical protein